MKTRSTLSLLVIFGIGTILLLPGNFAESSHTIPTAGNDVLLGHDGGETISGLAGHDQIFGFSGSDILNGDEGDDFIHGGSSSDVMDGGIGDDLMYGGQGGDKIEGGEGDDEIFGGGQGDTIRGGEDDDEIWGGAQSDAIFGGPGNDHIFGGLGSDNLFAGDGDDSVFGGVKNDNIFAGDGIDLLFGGVGNDHLIGSLVGQATLDGGEDDDDGDGFYNEDPLDFDQFGNEINNDADGGDGIPGNEDDDDFMQEDGPGNDNDVCFWDGGPTVIVDDPDGIPNTGDEVFGDDVLVLDDFGDPTCETVHVLGHDPITLGGKKGGGGGNAGNPGILTAAFVETVPVFPDEAAGTLTLTFNADISLGGSQAETLEAISVGNLGIPLLELTGSTFSSPHNDPSVTFTLTEALAILILGLNEDPGTILTVTVDANVFVNKFNNPNLASFIGLSVDAIDTSGPLVIGSAYVTGSGVLTVAFDEEVDELSVDQAGFHVRELGTSTGGETIAGASVASVGDTLVITLLEAQRLAINALASHELDVDAAAVADLDGNDNPGTNDTPITVQTDNTVPVVLSATYDSTFDILTISFTENIDASETVLANIFVSEDGNFVDNQLSAGATVTLVDGNPISITVTDAATITAIELLTTPELGVTVGAFSDLSGNGSTERIVPITLSPTDLFGPIIQPPAILDPTFETLKIPFDEEVDTTPDSQVDLSKVFVSEDGSFEDISLAGATLVTSSDDTTVEIQLTSTQFGDIDNLTTPVLDVRAGAFQDPVANPILAVADIPIDTLAVDVIKPKVASVSSDGSSLTITFSEEIDPGSVALDKIHISNNKKRNQFSLSGMGFAPAVGNTVIIVDISVHPNIAQINALAKPELDIGKNAFEDTSGNRNDRQNNLAFTP